jgi:hypothetical protein
MIPRKAESERPVEPAEVEKKKKTAVAAEAARTKRAVEKVGAPRHTMS